MNCGYLVGVSPPVPNIFGVEIREGSRSSTEGFDLTVKLKVARLFGDLRE